jgi:hypothetical protein
MVLLRQGKRRQRRHPSAALVTARRDLIRQPMVGRRRSYSTPCDTRTQLKLNRHQKHITIKRGPLERGPLRTKPSSFVFKMSKLAGSNHRHHKGRSFLSFSDFFGTNDVIFPVGVGRLDIFVPKPRSNPKINPSKGEERCVSAKAELHMVPLPQPMQLMLCIFVC